MDKNEFIEKHGLQRQQHDMKDGSGAVPIRELSHAEVARATDVHAKKGSHEGMVVVVALGCELFDAENSKDLDDIRQLPRAVVEELFNVIMSASGVEDEDEKSGE